MCLTRDGVSGAQLRQFLATHHTHLDDAVIREFCDRERVYSQDDTTLLLAVIADVPVPDSLNRLLSYAGSCPGERDDILQVLKTETYVPAPSLVEAFWAEENAQRQRELIELLRRHGGELRQDEWLALLHRCAAERRRCMPSLSEAARGSIRRTA